MPSDLLISTKQVAERCGVHPATVTRWVASGRLVPAAKVEGRTGAMLFRSADIALMVDAERQREAS